MTQDPKNEHVQSADFKDEINPKPESNRFDDGNVNDNATNQLFDWLNEEK